MWSLSIRANCLWLNFFFFNPGFGEISIRSLRFLSHYKFRSLFLEGGVAVSLSAPDSQVHWDRVVQYFFLLHQNPLTFPSLSFKWHQVLGAEARRVGRTSPQAETRCLPTSNWKEIYSNQTHTDTKQTQTNCRSLLWLLKQFSMTVCDNMLIRKQVCVKTVDCNTWRHVMKHIVKAIRPPECD